MTTSLNQMTLLTMPWWRSFSRIAIGALALLGASTVAVTEAAAACSADAVLVGDLCVDKYEASVWSKPPGGADPGTQYGIGNEGYPCAVTGETCTEIFAASIAGATPSDAITWFQAQQACANVGKRLLTNAEWQMAAMGTPDTGGSDDHATTCNTDTSAGVAETPAGSRAACVSQWGVFDMVGNVWEWTADWVPRSSDCPDWNPVFSDDAMCLAGADTTVPVPGTSSAQQAGPGALRRGGAFSSGHLAGPFALSAVDAATEPIGDGTGLGFRCARPLR